MTDCIEIDISKWKSIFSHHIRNASKEKEKDLFENNLNTQTGVNRSTFLKAALRNQVLSYYRDELLKDDFRLNRIRELWNWITLFLLIFGPNFPYDY